MSYYRKNGLDLIVPDTVYLDHFITYARNRIFKEEFPQVNRMQKQGRVESYSEADYTRSSQTVMWIENAVSEIADCSVINRQRALGDKIGKPPKHLE